MKFREITKKTAIDFIGLQEQDLRAVGRARGTRPVRLRHGRHGQGEPERRFYGWNELQIRFDQPVAIGDLRNALITGGIEDVQIQEVSREERFFSQDEAHEHGPAEGSG